MTGRTACCIESSATSRHAARLRRRRPADRPGRGEHGARGRGHRIPAILVPWPGATDDHQRDNIAWLTDVSGAVMLPGRASSTRLGDEIDGSAPRPVPARARARGRRAPLGRCTAWRLGLFDRPCGHNLSRRDDRHASSVVHGRDPSLRSIWRAPRRLHVVGVGGPGMSAIAIALAEMGHTVSGSDLREHPVLDRVRAAGVAVTSATIAAVVARLRRRHGVDGDPGPQHRTRRGAADRGHRADPGRHARRDLRPGDVAGCRRHARQDDDDVDADADPRRGGAATELRRRRRRHRRRHRRPVDRRRMVRRRGRRERRHPPRAAAARRRS